MRSLQATTLHIENNFENKAIFYKKLSRGSLTVILIFLLIQFVLILLNQTHKGLQVKMIKWNFVPNEHLNNRQGGLFGTQRDPQKKSPTWSFSQMLSGKWQKEYEHWFNTHSIPFRNKLIKIYNQVNYTIFSTSSMLSNKIVIGKKGYLYYLIGIEKYYNLARENFSPSMFNAWADEIQTLSKIFQRRKQTFVYVITGSKASYQPEYLPNCYRCDLKNTRPNYKGFTEVLKKRGLAFIDASEITVNAKKDFESYIYPKGGMHWSALAGALTAKELMKQIALNQQPLPQMEFSYQLTDNPRDIDKDLAAVLNVLSTPKHYSVPTVLVKSLKNQKKKNLKIAIVSGSFMFDPVRILAETKLFDQIDFFFYWNKAHYRYTADMVFDSTGKPESIDKVLPFKTIPLKKSTSPNAYQEILMADIVILEENETVIPAVHRKHFLNKMLQAEKILLQKK